VASRLSGSDEVLHGNPEFWDAPLTEDGVSEFVGR
jgi:hypothetical protein